MRKELVLSALKSNKLKPVVQNIVNSRIDTLMNNIEIIMMAHVGRDNAISGDELFEMLVGRPKDDYDTASVKEATMRYLADEILWRMIKTAMLRLRQNNRCWITNMQVGAVFKYFVVEDDVDVEYYINRLNKNIDRMRAMQRKARRWQQQGKIKDYLYRAKNQKWIETNQKQLM